MRKLETIKGAAAVPIMCASLPYHVDNVDECHLAWYFCEVKGDEANNNQICFSNAR
jgi:hypothetical protein